MKHPLFGTRYRAVSFAFCLLLLLSARALGQTAGTGALTGTVSDPKGALIADAQVTVTNEVTGEARKVMSQQNGTFLAPLLQPGPYRLEVMKAGFKKSIKEGLRVNVTETTRLDIELEVGAVDEQMTITSEAQMLQTESSTLGRVTDRALVSDLPLVTRNYTQIVTLSPGISASVTNATELGRGSSSESQGSFRAHGAFARDNNFQMNGVQINDLQASGFFSGGIAVPNPDAIQEFKVQTGLYDASFGRNAGANVNVVTKSGTNDYHGNVFEFLRNDALNANEFFRNKAGQPRGVLKQNQFGFTFGGPIKKDKLLFFGSYQGMRQVNGVGGGGTSSFFSPAFTDDRSRAALGRLFGGQAGAFGGTAVAADGSNISQQAVDLLNLKLPSGAYLIPTPQSLNPAQPFPLRGFSSFSEPATFDEDQFIVDIDFIHTAKSKFAGRFFFANSSQLTPFPATNLGGPASPGFPVSTDDKMRNLTISHIYTISPTLLNQFEFGFHRILVPTVQHEAFKWSDVGVKAPASSNDFPAIQIAGSMTIGGNGQGLSLNQNHFTFQDSVTWVRGIQTFRFGGGLTRSHLDLQDFHFLAGLIFQSWPDFLLGLHSGPAATGGNGTPLSNVIASIDIPGLLDREWRLTDWNAYAQDNIKLTPSLTLLLGLRYERFDNLGDKLGRNSGFDITQANPNPPAAGTINGFVVSENFPGTVPSGVSQVDNRFGILGEHMNSLDPRVGFAWQFMSRMVLRGGYGIYHTRATGQPFIQLAAGPPFALVRQLVGVPNGAATFASPFGPDLTFPQFPTYSPTTQRSISFIDQHYRPPVSQQFSLGLQTDLGGGFLLDVGYVGARGTHQILAHTQNQALLASASNPIRGVTTNTLANIPLRVPILGFTAPGISDIDSPASSWYHGLEASVNKRLRNGLQFLASYTFSRAYTDAATNTLAGGGNVAGDNNTRRANYGLADFNRAHRFVLSYLYQFPTPRFNAVVNGLLGGWTLAGVTTFQSGLPLTLTGTNANNVFGITNDRAQLAAGCSHSDLATPGSVNDKLNNYFSKGCVARNAAGTAVWPIIGDDGRATAFGNSGVGIAFGPDQRNFDIAIIKRTSISRLRENANIEFRAEFFNAFNTTQFSNPSTNVSSAAFGTITTTSVNPRVIQFGLKVNF
jgi:carboxypeptidase family protein/TonB-dependent receptor-like protein